jgi:hypothetical protein
MKRNKTDADILREIEDLVNSSKNERKKREGKASKTVITPYGKFDELTFQGKKKNVYNITERKSMSSSAEINRNNSTSSPSRKRNNNASRKGMTQSVDDLLRVYAEDLRSREKHTLSQEQMKLKTASVPFVETAKKIESYLDVNKPLSASDKGGNEKPFEIGKDSAYSPEFLDLELTEDNMPQALKPNTERLKHVSAMRFKKKYNRFVSNLQFTDIDLKDIQPKNDKWIVRFMETCYDEATNAFNSEGTYGKVAFYEGLNLGALDNFAYLVQRILTKYYSVLEIRKKMTLQVLYTIELLIQRSEMSKFKINSTASSIIKFDSNRALLFSKFLTEEYDLDVLCIFLYGRQLIQQTLNQKLKDLNPTRMVIKNVQNKDLIEKPFVQTKLFQQQQQLQSPTTQNNRSVAKENNNSTFFTETKGTTNSYLTNLYDTDKYLKTLKGSSPERSPSKLNNLQNTREMILDKIVPVELPSKWYYLVDVATIEAPLIGFHESLLWYFTCLIIPPVSDRQAPLSSSSSVVFSSSSSAALTEETVNMNQISKIRSYFQDKCWDINLFDCVKDSIGSSSRISKETLHSVSVYSFLRTLCMEWKKISREDKAEFSHEGLVVDSLKSLNEIYQDNCAKMKITQQSLLDAESDFVIAKAEVIKLEKELKRYERKFSRKLTEGQEVDKIALLREQLDNANVKR